MAAVASLPHAAVVGSLAQVLEDVVRQNLVRVAWTASGV